MLPGQDKPFHILFDTIVPCFPQTISFAVQHLIQSVTLRSFDVSKPSRVVGVQDLSADFQVSSPDGTSYSDKRPGFCFR